MTRISFAKRMSGRPFESRLLVERTLESLAAGGPEAMALTLELALDHYWRGEFARMHEVGRGVLELARAATEPRRRELAKPFQAAAAIAHSSGVWVCVRTNFGIR